MHGSRPVSRWQRMWRRSEATFRLPVIPPAKVSKNCPGKPFFRTHQGSRAVVARIDEARVFGHHCLDDVGPEGGSRGRRHPRCQRRQVVVLRGLGGACDLGEPLQAVGLVTNALLADTPQANRLTSPALLATPPDAIVYN